MTLIIPNHVANGLDADGNQLEQNFNSIKQWADAEAITADGATAMAAPLLLPAAMPTQPNQAASKAYVDAGVPVATMVMFAGDAAPDNWLFCRGQSLSRATYATLFAAIGVRFGSADGTTFNLPNMQGTAPVGYNSNVNPPAGIGANFSNGVGEVAGSLDTLVIAHTHQLSHAHAIPGHVHAATTTPAKNVHDMYSIVAAGGWPTNGNGGYAYQAVDGNARLGVDSPGLWNASLHSWSTSVGDSGQLFTGGQDNHTTSSVGGSGSNANLQPSMSLNFVIKVQ